MPGFDRTGPGGMGPMTGGGRGLCNHQGAGRSYRGFGFGFRGDSPSWPYVGRGRGGMPRCRYPQASGRGAAYAMPPAASYQPTSGEELDFLKEQSMSVKRNMEEIERRIQELEKRE